MAREVRRVPPTWEHPRDAEGDYVPLLDGYRAAGRAWDERAAQWDAGLSWDERVEAFVPKEAAAEPYSFAEWEDDRPLPEDYMPCWDPEEAPWVQMYETATDGTPISPPRPTPALLAQWLVENQALIFGSQEASYEAWLTICQGGVSGIALAVSAREECA
jgi:hypothetical protein